MRTLVEGDPTGFFTNPRLARCGASPKTVDHHIQHIYEKIGVSTRAAATLFAMRHDLLTGPTG